VRSPSAITAGGANRGTPPVDVFQLSDTGTLAPKNQDVDVSGAKLF
jgi:hypothetical protein